MGRIGALQAQGLIRHAGHKPRAMVRKMQLLLLTARFTAPQRPVHPAPCPRGLQFLPIKEATRGPRARVLRRAWRARGGT